jgi:glycosyltransferase involved in cell wall biosynthesis
MLRRVCIVRQGFYPSVRREAEALIDAGFAVDVVCLRDKDEPSRTSVGGARVYRVPLRHKRGRISRYLFEYLAFPIIAAFLVAGMHLRRRYCVIQVHSMPDHLVFVAAVPRLLGARVILDMHEAMPELFMSKFGDRKRLVRLITATERASMRFADLVLAVSEPHAALLAGRRGGEMPTVVMNSPDERLFHHRSLPTTPSGTRVLISHGTLVERYGFDTAILGVARLQRERREIRLEIIGDGEHEEVLRALVRDRGMEDTVKFHGRRPLDEIPEHLRRADVGIVANRQDTFTAIVLPTKLMEYVAAGIPAAVARLPAVEAYFDDASVQFFKPGDPDDLARALSELLDDPVRARQMAGRARERLAKHSWETMRQNYVEAVEALASGCAIPRE